MLKLFRRIREKVMHEGNLKKYLIYAVGEILLVMIGILLALQVNNWNERNKARKIELRALIDLKQEFENNKNSFDRILNSKKIILQQNRDFIDIIKEKSNDGLEILHGRSGLGDGGIYTFNPSNGVLNTLINTGQIDNIKNDSLKYLLTSWKDVIVDYQEEEQSHINFYSEIYIPYESTIIPYPYFKNGKAELPFHEEDQIESLYRASIKDLKYQNLILMNERNLNATVEEAMFVNSVFLRIVELIEKEISTKLR
jgi:hypothetical protein